MLDPSLRLPRNDEIDHDKKKINWFRFKCVIFPIVNNHASVIVSCDLEEILKMTMKLTIDTLDMMLKRTFYIF